MSEGAVYLAYVSRDVGPDAPIELNIKRHDRALQTFPISRAQAVRMIADLSIEFCRDVQHGEF